jgi:hypothetical protein
MLGFSITDIALALGGFWIINKKLTKSIGSVKEEKKKFKSNEKRLDVDLEKEVEINRIINDISSYGGSPAMINNLRISLLSLGIIPDVITYRNPIEEEAHLRYLLRQHEQSMMDLSKNDLPQERVHHSSGAKVEIYSNLFHHRDPLKGKSEPDGV